MFAYAKTLWMSGIFLLNLKTIFPQLGKYTVISDKMIEMVSIFLREYSVRTVLRGNIQKFKIYDNPECDKNSIMAVRYEILLFEPIHL